MTLLPTKSSGSEWLGDVPAHWDVCSLKYFATFQRGHDLPAEQRRDGAFPVVSSGGVIGTHDTAVARGPGIVTGRYGSIGEFHFVPSDYWALNTALYVRDFRRNEPRFVYYALSTLRDLFIMESKKSAVPGVDRNDLHVYSCAVPPRSEQRAIAAFLDGKTAITDALIAKKERLIELLQEKRQALITQAVTKGLDPNVPMKESGVEWLGAAPTHWLVQELRHRIRRIEQGWSPSCESREADDGEWGVLKVGCVNYGGFRETENKALPLDLKPMPDLEVRVGDVLVSRANTRELVGSAAYVERTRSRLLLCDKLFRIHYRASDTDPRFLVLLLQSDLCRFQFEREATGASGSMQNIGQDSVRRLLFGWAPLEEQRQLVLHVGARTAQLDTLKSRLEEHIERLREYRQALITAAVTGKIDLSKEAA